MTNLTIAQNDEIFYDKLGEYIDLEGLSEEMIEDITSYAVELSENGDEPEYILKQLEILISELKKSFAIYSKRSVIARNLARKAFLAV